ncbi:MAG: hypothetical protein ABGW87_00745 [Sphingomonadaceae bacterium]
MVAKRRTGFRWLKWLVVALGLLALLFLLATSSHPWVPTARAATAQQVKLTRLVFQAARKSRAMGKPVQLTLDQQQLDAASTMIGQGFPPNRLAAQIHGDRLTVTASRPFMGRWINVRGITSGKSDGFPDLSVRVGAIPIPGWMAKFGLGMARRLMILRGATLPPLDTLVAGTNVSKGLVTAQIMLPRTGLVDQASGDGALAIDDDEVARLYCKLAAEQRANPDPLFAHQMRRAMALSTASRESDGAALVALAMLAVNKQVGQLVGDADTKSAKCKAPPGQLTLQGRTDSPKHWSLSAALEVTTGRNFTVAMGEWKELSDSLASNPYLAKGDASGFSFVDLATDRAGFLTAKNLMDPAKLADTRARMMRATDDMLLPKTALTLSDGMPNAQFVAAYGGTDDPRFKAKVQSIDAMLKADGID